MLTKRFKRVKIRPQIEESACEELQTFRFDTLRSPLPDIHYPVLVRRELSQGATLRHEHHYHEIVLVESGSATHLTEAGTQTLCSGDIIIIKPRMWHAYRKTRDFQIINCIYDKRILQDHLKLVTMVEGAYELFLRPLRKGDVVSPILLHAQPAQRVRMLDNLEMILEEIDLQKRDWRAVVALRLLDFMIAICRLDRGGYEVDARPLSNHALEAVDQAVVHLEENYTRDISLSQISVRLNICPSYLSRVFSRRMGMGVVQYLHHLRVDEACRRLRGSDIPIGVIASEIGYNEIAYFSRRFRKEMGVSAMDYRKKYRGQ